MTDPITEDDLHAFVDDQLPTERRLDVEDHLVRHPEIAARVMADLRARDALKLVFDRRVPANVCSRPPAASSGASSGAGWA
jgi:anti-sigma factor RsiW